VGEYFADIIVEHVLVIELKCAERLSNEHPAQCLNYWRASGRTLCLLVNFQKPKVEWNGSESFTDFRLPSRSRRHLCAGKYHFVCAAISWTLH